MVLTFSVLQADITPKRIRLALHANLSKFRDSPKLFPKSFFTPALIPAYNPLIPNYTPRFSLGGTATHIFCTQEKQAAGDVPRLPVYSSEEPLPYRVFFKFTLSSKS